MYQMPNFKKTRFYVATLEESHAVQRAMFTLGFKWRSTGRGVEREVNDFPRKGYIYVDSNCRMWKTDGKTPFMDTVDGQDFSEFKPAYQAALFAAAEAHKAYKKAEKKAQRKRASLRKQGFVVSKKAIEKPDVPDDTEVAVILRDGSFMHGYPVDAFRWGEDIFTPNNPRDIVGYKLQEGPTIVSQADMVADIVSSAGGREVVEVDSDGFIVWNGGECPVAEGVRVDVKYRGASFFRDQIVFGVRALLDDGVEADFWHNDGLLNDIVAYRIATYQDVAEVAPVEDTNPKRQYGVQSVPLNMWSNLASAYGALGLYNGALKYGTANFTNTKVEASIYIAAIKRHLAAWEAGEEDDPADGVPNLGGVLANVAIILEARAAGTLIDDRPKMSGYLKERDKLKGKVGHLNELHEGKTPRHYTMGG